METATYRPTLEDILADTLATIDRLSTGHNDVLETEGNDWLRGQHTGYRDAYSLVARWIREDIKRYNNIQKGW